jgi:hypothetical protein
VKKIAILQSNYIPWKGYFDIIGMVDEFIIYDEVQYTKNDWRNRNKIKTPKGIQWITIPVYQRNLLQRISETVTSDPKWKQKNWSTLKTNYGRAPFFKLYAPQFEEFYTNFNSPFLSEINVYLLKLICEILKIKTSITNSAAYQLSGNPTEKLVSLCIQAGASTYLSGPAAKTYLEEDYFKKAGIQVEWMDYTNYPEYSQLYMPFEHGVSILDLLFNTGPDASTFMKYQKK